jgi:hypothetical protein
VAWHRLPLPFPIIETDSREARQMLGRRTLSQFLTLAIFAMPSRAIAAPPSPEDRFQTCLRFIFFGGEFTMRLSPQHGLSGNGCYVARRCAPWARISPSAFAIPSYPGAAGTTLGLTW